MTILFWFYQLAFLLFGPVYLLLRLAGGRRMTGWGERLGWYSLRKREGLSRLRRPIWIHLVSVGEAMAAQPLVEELRRRFPEKGWLITTVTDTGRAIAQRLVREGKDEILFLPWDLAPIVGRLVRRIKPSLFLSFETELWPVLFQELSRQEVPIAVVNGRISPRAYRRYLWIRPLMERALAPANLFLTQSPQDARRFAVIGAAKDRLMVTGNMKWDVRLSAPGNGLEPERLRSLLGLKAGDLLWTAGSTHPGEEAALLRVYRQLLVAQPNLKLLIAPRHPERTGEVEAEARKAGFKPERWSRARHLEALRPLRQAQGPQDDESSGATVVILDTLGELTAFYRISDFVFVGGSLVPHGGHNLVEPAVLSRCIFSGPHLHNFQAISESLLQAGGMVRVKSEQDLGEKLGRMLTDRGAAAEMGRRAYGVFKENQGAVKRTADLIELRWRRHLEAPDPERSEGEGNERSGFKDQILRPFDKLRASE